MREITHIIIHHTATPWQLNADDLNGSAIFEVIKKNQKANALKQGASQDYVMDYHFVVGHTGSIFQGQPIEMVGWHCGNQGMNLKSIGICFLGNFMKEAPTAIQLDAGETLTSMLAKKYNIPIQNIMEHKDIVATDCPGKFFPWIKFQNDVKFLMENSGEVLEAWNYFVKNGIYKSDGRIDYPTREISRKELAVIIIRLLKNLNLYKGGA